MHTVHPHPFLARTGRMLLSVIFLVTGISKITGWSGSIDYMQANGIGEPWTPILLAAALVIELACGIALLIGFRERAAALLLVLYLIPVTLVLHSFWEAAAADVMSERIAFLKNLAIMGGLLAVYAEAPVRAVVHPREREVRIHPSDEIPVT